MLVYIISYLVLGFIVAFVFYLLEGKLYETLGFETQSIYVVIFWPVIAVAIIMALIVIFFAYLSNTFVPFLSVKITKTFDKIINLFKRSKKKMTDEEILFREDVSEKSSIAQSVNKKGRNSASRSLNDYTNDELLEKNGEIAEFCLKQPMTYEQYKAMREDLRKEYINILYQNGGTTRTIAEMFNIKRSTMFTILSRLDIHPSKGLRENAEAWNNFISKAEGKMDCNVNKTYKTDGDIMGTITAKGSLEELTSFIAPLVENRTASLSAKFIKKPTGGICINEILFSFED